MKKVRYINVVIPSGCNDVTFVNIKNAIFNKFDMLFKSGGLDSFLILNHQYRFQFQTDMVKMFNSYNKENCKIAVYLENDGYIGLDWFDLSYELHGGQIWINYEEFIKLDNFNYFFNGVKLGLL